MRKVFATALGAALLVTGLGTAAEAQHHDDHRRGDPHWHGDIHAFHDRDFSYWRGGHWFHGRRGGQFGWWWVVGPTFYFYSQPVYPYPNPYVPPVASAAPPSGTWYYCANPQGYYPYVPQCGVPWQAVPAR
jgi:hypothetical protein